MYGKPKNTASKGSQQNHIFVGTCKTPNLTSSQI